jgi:DNA-nicking Smr family endonuclease
MSGGRKSRRHVSPEEAKLWRAVTKQFVPLEPSREQFEAPLDAEKPDPPAPQTIQPSKTHPPRPPSNRVSTKPAQTGEAALAEFDHRRARRISSGRLPIEARLDLHGMRQEEARSVLLRFLSRAQGNGLRHVKVITGKGAKNQEDADFRPFSLFEGGRRGVLREQVPRWLAESEFRRLVVSFTIAGPGHGGGGALYVQVRKKTVSR